TSSATLGWRSASGILLGECETPKSWVARWRLQLGFCVSTGRWPAVRAFSRIGRVNSGSCSHSAPKKLRERLGFDRPAEQKTLKQLVASFAQDLRLTSILHALGHDLEAQVPCEPDNRANDVLIGCVHV